MRPPRSPIVASKSVLKVPHLPLPYIAAHTAPLAVPSPAYARHDGLPSLGLSPHQACGPSKVVHYDAEATRFEPVHSEVEDALIEHVCVGTNIAVRRRARVLVRYNQLVVVVIIRLPGEVAAPGCEATKSKESAPSKASKAKCQIGSV